MRAQFVLITTLCGAMFLVGACQQDTGPRDADSSGTSEATGTMSGGSTSDASSPGASSSSGPTSVRRVFDSHAMQASVRRLLTEKYGIEGVQQATCPSGEEVVDGNTFRCTVLIDGAQRKVEITVRGDEGEYVVSRPE